MRKSPELPAYGPPGPVEKKAGMPTWVVVVAVSGALLIVFGGVLSALAIYGVRKYIANAKVAEAQGALGAIGVDAQQAFERGVTTAKGEQLHRVCPSASSSVPASVASVKGMKYLSGAGEWDVDRARNAGFACLGFSMTTPQYFMYSYHAHGSSKPGDGFTAEAVADLAGDGNLLTLRSTGKISASHTLDVVPPGPR
jgi:type IV pilus assembly protein PilA